MRAIKEIYQNNKLINTININDQDAIIKELKDFIINYSNYKQKKMFYNDVLKLTTYANDYEYNTYKIKNKYKYVLIIEGV